MPPLPEHATVDKASAGTVQFGETLTYNCQAGYRKTGVGSSTIVCKQNGHFTAKPALCECMYTICRIQDLSNYQTKEINKIDMVKFRYP